MPCLWWQQDFPDTTPAELLDGTVPADIVVCSSDAVVLEQRQAAPWSRPIKIHLGVAVDEVAARHGSGARVRETLGVGRRRSSGSSAGLRPTSGRISSCTQRRRSPPSGRTYASSSSGVRSSARGATSQRGWSRWRGSSESEDASSSRATRRDAYAWIDALDVLAHAAEREPFGLVLVEALVLGKPVVAVDAAGPSEIVEDGRSGLLVPPGDPDALAHAILRALADPSVARGARARAQEFTDARMAGAFADALGALVGVPA